MKSMGGFKDDIRKIRQSLIMGLPGALAHQKLAPQHRNAMMLDYMQLHPDYKTACVMLLLYPYQNQSTLVFIERTDAGNHAGQIALPGGKTDLEETHIQTALRETFEEIGVSVSEDKIWSRLTELYIPPSNFLVHPFLAILEEKPIFTVNTEEVKRIIEIPLFELMSEGVLSQKIFTTTSGKVVKAPCYSLAGIEIWGATAMIISEFICLFNDTSNLT